MNISLILAHPDKKSFNHAIAQRARQTLISANHTVFYHDLYAEKFDPILFHQEFPKSAAIDASLQKYCDELIASDSIIIVHPNWWGQPPAILKGWVDRIVRPGLAYEFEEGDSGGGVPIGLLKAKFALIFNTSNTSAEREENIFKDPLELLWKNCIFDFCGVDQFYRKMYRIIVTSTDEERRAWLEDVEEIIKSYL